MQRQFIFLKCIISLSKPNDVFSYINENKVYKDSGICTETTEKPENMQENGNYKAKPTS